MIKLNQSVARSFPILLLILLLFVGCGDNDNDLPETAAVRVELTEPKVLSPSDALHLTISTDFQGILFSETETLSEILSIDSTDLEGIASNGLIYNTKKEFSITQDFNRTFQLDPDTPRIYVQVINPGPSVSVHLTILTDGEVEYKEEQLLTWGSGFGVGRFFD